MCHRYYADDPEAYRNRRIKSMGKKYCAITLRKKWNFSKIYSISYRTMKWQKNKIVANKSINFRVWWLRNGRWVNWCFMCTLPVWSDGFEFCFVFFSSYRPSMPFEFNFMFRIFLLSDANKEKNRTRLNGAKCHWNNVQCDVLCCKRWEGHCL